MSATNRGSKRINLDFYPTPEATIHSFLNAYNLNMNELNIYEPCAGNGSICRVIREKYPNSSIWANEIRGEERCNLQSVANMVTLHNFLEVDNLNGTDIVISNPPYSLAKEIIEHCFKISNVGTTIIMLLRLAFLESDKRYDFWQEYPVDELYILRKRPSFTGKGTDASAYGWFVWYNVDHNVYSKEQIIKVIY